MVGGVWGKGRGRGVGEGGGSGRSPYQPSSIMTLRCDCPAAW